MLRENILKIFKNINNYLKKMSNLDIVQKLFIIFLIIMSVHLLFKNREDKNFLLLETFDDDSKDYKNKNFIKKRDREIYDEYYTKNYNYIHYDKNISDFQLNHVFNMVKGNKKNKKILILDSKTGIIANNLSNRKYNITAIDDSEAMINYAYSKYNKDIFINTNFIDTQQFDLNSFSYICCFTNYFYEITEKKEFFEKCYNLLSNNGILILTLYNRDIYNPLYVTSDLDKIVFDPKDYNKETTQSIVKIDKNNECLVKYNKLDYNSNDLKVPYSNMHIRFKNYKTKQTREYEIELYMPKIDKIISLANENKFKLVKKVSMENIKHPDKYIYTFIKVE